MVEGHKVALASVHLDSKAKLWFRRYMEGRELLTWEQFQMLVLERFDDQDLELIIGDFNKLNKPTLSLSIWKGLKNQNPPCYFLTRNFLSFSLLASLVAP